MTFQIQPVPGELLASILTIPMQALVHEGYSSSQAPFPITACSGADPVFLQGAIILQLACFLPNHERDLHGTGASSPRCALYF